MLGKLDFRSELFEKFGNYAFKIKIEIQLSLLPSNKLSKGELLYTV